jgi:hypothetical protein
MDDHREARPAALMARGVRRSPGQLSDRIGACVVVRGVSDEGSAFHV